MYECKVCKGPMDHDWPSGVCSALCLRIGQGFEPCVGCGATATRACTDCSKPTCGRAVGLCGHVDGLCAQCVEAALAAL